MRVLSVAVAASFLVAGCANDTDIVGALELVGDRVALAVDGSITSVGLIDGWVLITTTAPALEAPEAWGPTAGEVQVRWLDPEDRLGDPFALGRSQTTWVAPRWVRRGAQLSSAVWATPEPGPEPPEADRAIAIWDARAGEAPTCGAVPALPIATDPFFTTLTLSGYLETGYEGYGPAAVAGSSVVAYAAAVPAECGVSSAIWRLLTVSDSDCHPTASFGLWTDACAAGRDVGDAVAWVGSPSAITLGEDTGVLYRPRYAGSRVHWLRLRHGVEAVSAPVSVGGRDTTTTDSGGQSPGAMIGDQVLFLERWENDHECFYLRSMNLDGTAARDAPWQMPCTHFAPGVFSSSQPSRDEGYTDVLALSTIGLLVHSDGPAWYRDPPDPDPTTHIHALGVTSAGRRATEIVDIGGVGNDTAQFFRAAADRDDVAIAYVDADGWWLQRLRFVPR
jgi:hypothetical protein